MLVRFSCLGTRNIHSNRSIFEFITPLSKYVFGGVRTATGELKRMETMKDSRQWRLGRIAKSNFEVIG
jgi:hypothetical protein